jgi:hypothetical protein
VEIETKHGRTLVRYGSGGRACAPVTDTETGTTYHSVQAAATALGVSTTTINAVCRGRRGSVHVRYATPEEAAATPRPAPRMPVRAKRPAPVVTVPTDPDTATLGAIRALLAQPLPPTQTLAAIRALLGVTT